MPFVLVTVVGNPSWPTAINVDDITEIYSMDGQTRIRLRVVNELRGDIRVLEDFGSLVEELAAGSRRRSNPHPTAGDFGGPIKVTTKTIGASPMFRVDDGGPISAPIQPKRRVLNIEPAIQALEGLVAEVDGEAPTDTNIMVATVLTQVVDHLKGEYDIETGEGEVKTKKG